jgi:hypothetical protein
MKRQAKRLHKKAKTPAQRRTVLGRASKLCARKKLSAKRQRAEMSPKMKKLIEVLEGGLRQAFAGRANWELPEYLTLKIPNEYYGEGTVMAGVRDIVAKAGEEDAKKAVSDYIIKRAMDLVKTKPVTPKKLKDAIKASPEMDRIWLPFELE